MISNKTLCISYIVFWVGMACADIGEMPTNQPEPYSWYLPLLILAFLLPVAITGYLAGKEG